MTGGTALGAILLAVCGGVLYHVSAKSIPSSLPPALSLVVAYAAALVLSALAHLALPAALHSPPVARLIHPAVVGLGVGAAMIELGYVVAYRSASPLSTTSIVVNGTVAAALVPIGLLVFGEYLTVPRVTGLLLCVVGVWLLQR
jgi:drug/metabolite transporter (DMT)-like permease